MCNHCFVIVDVRINKKVRTNQGILEINDTYYCLECGEIRKQGDIYQIYSSELDVVENGLVDGYDRRCVGDEELLIAIYNRIKVRHPNISVPKMVKYICAALYNMETKPITLERHKKRILRLNLTPEFNNWDKRSVIHYGDSI